MVKKRQANVVRRGIADATPESAYRAARPLLFDVWEHHRGVSFDAALVEIERRVAEETTEARLKGLTLELLQRQDCRERLLHDWNRWCDV